MFKAMLRGLVLTLVSIAVYQIGKDILSPRDARQQKKVGRTQDRVRERVAVPIAQLPPEGRSTLQRARRTAGWQADEVQEFVARVYPFFGDGVSGRIVDGDEARGESLEIEFAAPADRDCKAAERTYRESCDRVSTAEVDQAIGPLRDLVSDFPEVARYHRVLGQIYLETGRKAQAEIELQRALMLDGVDLDALALLGNIYLERGSPDRALPLFERAVQLARTPYTLTHFAAALRDAGQLDHAIRVYEQAKEEFPAYTPARIGLRLARQQAREGAKPG